MAKAKTKLVYPLDKDSNVLFYERESQIVVDMSPKEFLNSVVPPLAWYQPSLKFITNSIKKKKPLEPLFLDVRSNDCRVVGHEGRHRAKVAQDLGLETVPVVIFCRERIKTPFGDERDALTEADKCKVCLGRLKRQK